MPGQLERSKLQDRPSARRRLVRQRDDGGSAASHIGQLFSERKPVIALGLLGLMLAVSGIFMVRFSFPTGQMAIVQKRYETAHNELTVVRIALERFRRDCGRYPTTQEGLLALVSNPGASGWRGHYITHLRSDPWRTRYVYMSDGQTFSLFSCGPDGEAGTDDDIAAPDLSAEELAPYLSLDGVGNETGADQKSGIQEKIEAPQN